MATDAEAFSKEWLLDYDRAVAAEWDAAHSELEALLRQTASAVQSASATRSRGTASPPPRKNTEPSEHTGAQLQVVTILSNPEGLGMRVDPHVSPPVVTEVAPDSAAERAGVKAGDAICRLNSRLISNGNDFEAAMEEFEGEDIRMYLAPGANAPASSPKYFFVLTGTPAKVSASKLTSMFSRAVRTVDPDLCNYIGQAQCKPGSSAVVPVLTTDAWNRILSIFGRKTSSYADLGKLSLHTHQRWQRAVDPARRTPRDDWRGVHAPTEPAGIPAFKLTPTEYPVFRITPTELKPASVEQPLRPTPVVAPSLNATPAAALPAAKPVPRNRGSKMTPRSPKGTPPSKRRKEETPQGGADRTDREGEQIADTTHADGTGLASKHVVEKEQVVEKGQVVEKEQPADTPDKAEKKGGFFRIGIIPKFRGF
eukprot:TRINITY_DN11499_c0_g1_i1.p1 TRINITY_DN11499_c0_g1~~TRINITY_DN11499_c0_g1_i1.p1  ORF type:complete len:443 (+),score=108.37 TRINITY_DN11499_c0_g1_i1:55-1329(+)